MEELRFLADESCDFAVVRALREAGFDVLAVSEVTIRSEDQQLINQADDEGRILLTEDKDFGWLVYVSHEISAGVVLIRFPGNARSFLSSAILDLINDHSQELTNSFVVVQPGFIRIRRGFRD